MKTDVTDSLPPKKTPQLEGMTVASVPAGAIPQQSARSVAEEQLENGVQSTATRPIPTPPNDSGSVETRADSAERHDLDRPERLLFAVFTRRSVAIGSACLLTLAILLLLIGIFIPSLYNNEIARFLVCFATSFSLALAVFALYPHQVTASPGGLPGWRIVEVSGPAALFFVMFFVMLSNFPSVLGDERYFKVEVKRSTEDKKLVEPISQAG